MPILRDFTDVLASFVVCRAVRFRSFFGTGVDGMFKICNPLCLHLTPLSVTVCHLPYILLCKTQEKRFNALLSHYLSNEMDRVRPSPLPCRSITGCHVSHIEEISAGRRKLKRLYNL